MKKILPLFWMMVVFLGAYFLPMESLRFQGALLEAFHMIKEYAREHVLFCLVPAFFIAGAISVFVNQTVVMKYFGAQAKKTVAYTVAALSGTILAVCSCTVLPIFSGIYKRGAGIGPATAFLYSGPAINVLAIILTARVLGPELGLARAIGAVVFAVVVGMLMALIFRHDEAERQRQVIAAPVSEESRPLWQNGVYFLTLVLILIFAAWGKPKEPIGFFMIVYSVKWPLVLAMLTMLALELWRWFKRDEITEWTAASWGFARQILPLLLGGVLVAGLLMGRPQTDTGLIPAQMVEQWVGSGSLASNFFAAIAGAFMYFATLTEVPILQGLIGAGMAKGPALALLLAGPALSLPNMLVIRSVLGNRKTAVYILIVVIMATLSGWLFGLLGI
ncbi:permease [bacterium]|nr:permease [bacterium]